MNKNPSQERPRRPHIEKIYVKVNSDFDQTGMVTPRSITWEDGREFEIEKVESFRPASTLESGRTGDCYTVIIRGERKYFSLRRICCGIIELVDGGWKCGFDHTVFICSFIFCKRGYCYS